MLNIELIGLIAAFFTTAAFVPQVWQILRTGNVEGISVAMYSIFTVGIACWLWYGILLNNVPVMIANAITLVLASMVLFISIYKRFYQRS